MDSDAAAVIVASLKAGARASPRVPVGVPPRERYCHLPDGLSLCLTMDILTQQYVNGIARITGVKVPVDDFLFSGSKFWHLSIARTGPRGPTPEEVDFWRRAFFTELPFVELPGIISGVNSRHFFWRAEGDDSAMDNTMDRDEKLAKEDYQKREDYDRNLYRWLESESPKLSPWTLNGPQRRALVKHCEKEFSADSDSSALYTMGFISGFQYSRKYPEAEIEAEKGGKDQDEGGALHGS